MQTDTDTDTDLATARADREAADEALADACRAHRDAVDRAAAVAADPGAQSWEAEAAASSVEVRGRMVASHERLAEHHRGAGG